MNYRHKNKKGTKKRFLYFFSEIGYKSKQYNQ